MKAAGPVPDAARREVTRILWISRAGGLAVALVMAATALYIHWGNLGSLESIAQFTTVAMGLGAFVILSTVARLAHARVLEHSLDEVQKLSGQLRASADTDALTGLLNLRAFHRRLDEEIRIAGERDASVSLVVMDLDNFKLLNDSFGHQFGDEVLRATAKVFSACGDGESCAARLGGDEFAIVLPGRSREEALDAAREVELAIREVRIEERQPATLGSFGIGTYPNDGETVQSLFAAADSRMYSEKHRRKADSLSSLAGAARKLFVRVGRAMRPDDTTEEILQEIATAAKEEFSLVVCVLFVHDPARQERMLVAAARDSDLEASCLLAAEEDALDSQLIAALIPGETWIIETPIQLDAEQTGSILLAGMPMSSFRPDAPVALALADLVQAVIANGRAKLEAARAGRERDIYIELAREIAGPGSLDHRLGAVTRLIADFIGATSVSIEGLVATATGSSPHNIAGGASAEFLDEWRSARATPEARRFLEALATEAPCILPDPSTHHLMPDAERRLIAAAGLRSSALCPIRFDGETLGLLGAASTEEGFFDDKLLDVLLAIADHLAPSIKVALLHDELEASYAQLEKSSRDALARLADAAEGRDPHTSGHLHRIRAYCIALATQLGLSETEATAIGDASAIHDLGKLRLPDAVLMNPGKLSAEDWTRMREHPQDGERLIGDSPMFTVERVVARWHHERWDGSGYPDGLAGEAIPIAARIVAVADAFDALTTERPYKQAWDAAEAFAEILARKGTLFCPAVVSALETLYADGSIAAILDTFAPEADPHWHEGIAA